LFHAARAEISDRLLEEPPPSCPSSNQELHIVHLRRFEMTTDDKSISRRIRACTLLEKHADEAEALSAEWLNGIAEALEARRVVRGLDDEQLDLGPDHPTRMAAARQFNELVLGCRRAPVEKREKAPPTTVEDFIEICKQRQAEKPREIEANAAAKMPGSHGSSKILGLEVRNERT
jgi:hypothetical protein